MVCCGEWRLRNGSGCDWRRLRKGIGECEDLRSIVGAVWDLGWFWQCLGPGNDVNRNGSGLDVECVCLENCCFGIGVW